jgi:hypothetical protein
MPGDGAPPETRYAARTSLSTDRAMQRVRLLRHGARGRERVARGGACRIGIAGDPGNVLRHRPHLADGMRDVPPKRPFTRIER